jgi:hypothetical protein
MRSKLQMPRIKFYDEKRQCSESTLTRENLLDNLFLALSRLSLAYFYLPFDVRPTR